MAATKAPLVRVSRDLGRAVRALEFGEPITHVYDPLLYARRPHEAYLERYGRGPKAVVFLGMNPGPFGMAQTGVPFGDVTMVTGFLGIEARVDRPSDEHPKRPVLGFACPRSEVSGRRLWGWVRDRFATPERFFARSFVANYCPLCFLEASGRNRTPNELGRAEREPLYSACDQALRAMVEILQPRWLVGIGSFATERARAALGQRGITVVGVLHPSPANPQANRGWAEAVERELGRARVEL
jgi:single-strand selective monofunctional uracil DNA glycosylase